MSFYAVYSLAWVSYNTPKAVMIDFIAQMKPFCFFCVSYTVVPKFDSKTKILLRYICVLNAIIVLICYITGLTKVVFMHVAYLGLVSMLSFLVYLLSSIEDNGKVQKGKLIIAVIILTIGLVSTRSKFYGEYVLALYMLFMYKPGLLKTLKLKQLILAIAIVGVVLFVTWEKIDYYFISGGQVDMAFDEDLLSTFARPIMYASMFVIIGLHPLLGSGFASFGTYASSTSVNYSNLYSVIGIDGIWGLSEDFDTFICDAYYPSLAQFGIVGIFLFIYFFVWVYKKNSVFLYTSGKVVYSVGVISIVVILIESIAATSFNQGAGAMCMMILGYLLSQFKNMSKIELREIRQGDYKDKKALDFIKK